MKKPFLFALLFAAIAGAAHAYTEPIPNVAYWCDYVKPLSPAKDPGFSWFTLPRSYDPDGRPMFRGSETFTSVLGGTDGRKATFAKPVNMRFLNLGFDVKGTRWEFTIGPYGPQCKQTDVINDPDGGQTIYFNDCTDGHSRTCSYY